jgi:membrane fusion protein (multidrug efflux system)
LNKNAISKSLQLRHFMPFLMVFSSLLATACGGSGDNGGADGRPGAAAGREEPAIAVRVGDVALEPISSLYSTSATLRADRQATVIARTRGVIERLVVEEGDRVRAGQPLAYLEDDEQEIAAVRAKSAEEKAKRDFDRLSGLHDRGLSSLDEFEASRTQAEDAAHALELAELELSRTIIRAPIAGVVVTRHLDVGATVSDGTPVYDLADLDPLYADVNIPERHVTSLRPGQEVRLAADSTDTIASALIERIAPAVDPATGTVKVTVAVEGESGLRPGAFVRVDIVTDTHLDALVVERSALVAEGRRWHLYRLGDEDLVEQIEVVLGFENGQQVEIDHLVDPELTLSNGDQVVIVGAPALSDGAKVRVMTETEAADDEEAAG